MAPILPFKIDVPQATLDRLKQKLTLADLPDEPSGVEPWSRGVPLPVMKHLVEYWRDEYDWRKAEAQLNHFPQFTTQIELRDFGTYKVHFVHQQSKVENAIPLLFLHGWPSSFMEGIKIIPELVKCGPDFPAFHVVAPSLMDYGFSDATRMPNKPTQEDNPELHAKMLATPPTTDDEEVKARHAQFLRWDAGYFHIQRTRPQTIAYSLADSPVGLLAWIYEKLHDFTDNYPWEDDELLTWISIYWFSTAGPGAQPRIYYEFFNKEPISEIAQSGKWADAPLGVARFPKEPSNLPKLWHEALGPIVQWTEFSKGGHFSAYEMPDEIVAEVRKMFGKNGGAAGVVKGRSGYKPSK
ncbi:hypothetical protein LTR10_023979 [Elasticomyces elasticus]|uniref:Epoxide hydrolase N-terminal domain-containing protein n=1 Tax=Exophiala sideris TaxID=1016849 RepID=A0ABR0IUH4_9EURO|nr:hypothetical protein LTR10_023979 [Elasticomyces elasticus]KAK5020922.1 hypothetical protein LTS07_011357 [Exophiala sideris]KAK5022984.1 hypothetical protein LTR13_011369 [Exophiala sideris]KAK5048469.1 hypothetical protein LTR69_011337 [Exophiala sideris]KAK5176041.1 hypothetical protein LTR44_011400 [Eurotiomycetes sp. CCFEE 6388]